MLRSSRRAPLRTRLEVTPELATIVDFFTALRRFRGPARWSGGGGDRGVQRHPVQAGDLGWDDPPEIIWSCSEHIARILGGAAVSSGVWIEKDALTGVIEGVSDDFARPGSRVVAMFRIRRCTPLANALRGYRQGQVPLVLHFGDHDPTGVDMSRDVRERLKMFARQEIEVRRIALNLARSTACRPTSPRRATAASRIMSSCLERTIAGN